MRKGRKAETGNRKAEASRSSLSLPAGSESAHDSPVKPSPVSGFHSPLFAFTLIELLVVMAIIAILAGLVLSTAGYVQKKGATSRAEAEVAALSAALESYKADMGDYPALTNGDPTVRTMNPGSDAKSKELQTNLMPPIGSSGKVYFEFNKSMTNAAGAILDPFGNRYGYMYPGKNSGSNFFDLWSTAGTTNTNAWIKNW